MRPADLSKVAVSAFEGRLRDQGWNFNRLESAMPKVSEARHISFHVSGQPRCQSGPSPARRAGLRLIPAALLVTALAGCQDLGPTTPLRPDAARPQAIAAAPLQDALHRIVPTLGSGAAVADVRSAITALLTQQSDASMARLESALERLTSQDPDAAVEADAIRLATIWP